MYRSMFSRDLFAELDRLQREMTQAFEMSPNIRGGGFPALHADSSPQSVDVRAWAPGLDPTSIDIHVEKGVLTIAGERKSTLPAREAKATVHFDERFSGRFRRAVSLPEDADTSAVQASYRDGVLHIHVPRRAAAQPRRIAIQ